MFASRLVMAGVDLRTVQELMGHKSIEMTVRYSHLAPKHTLAAVERLTATESVNSLALQLAPAPLSKIKPKRGVSSKLFHGKMLQYTWGP